LITPISPSPISIQNIYPPLLSSYSPYSSISSSTPSSPIRTYHTPAFPTLISQIYFHLLQQNYSSDEQLSAKDFYNDYFIEIEINCQLNYFIKLRASIIIMAIVTVIIIIAIKLKNRIIIIAKSMIVATIIIITIIINNSNTRPIMI